MKLAQDFKDRGLAVVTYCGNASDEATIEEAKEIIGEYNFNANLAASDEFNKALPTRNICFQACQSFRPSRSS